MVSAISSINQYPPNREVLEVVRRLQSLGLSSTGNINIDRQRLQTAEIKKKQLTLTSNSEPNLNKLQGTGNDFSSALNNISLNKIDNNSIGVTSQNDLINSFSANAQISDKTNNKYSMIGASQLAELNKLKLGLIA